MTFENDLNRLVQKETPSPLLRSAIHARIQAKIAAPAALQASIRSVVPAESSRQRLKDRIFSVIHPKTSIALEAVAGSLRPSADVFARIKEAILTRLEPVHQPFFGFGLKWTAAVAVFVLAIRAMPFLLLAPSTYADVRVQLIPSGNVSLYVGGLWQPVTTPTLLRGSTMIRTEHDGSATLIFGDKGIVRIDSDSTFKAYDVLTSRSSLESTGRLIKGKLWALGLIPSFATGIAIETTGGAVSINTGSVGIEDDGTKASITAYDRGATVTNTKQTVFLVTGERVVTMQDAPLSIQTLGTNAFSSPWVTENLRYDSVHRFEITKLQNERQAELVGILPTDFLYPAKRFAEKVDVLFTLTHDGRTEKRIAQANTRLHEALTLMRQGDGKEAQASLLDYKDSIVQMAADKEDNVVQYIIRKQIADASLSVISDASGPAASVELLKQAVSDVSAALPATDLKPKDVAGNILVDTLARIHFDLSQGQDIASAAKTYTEIRPYIADLLDEKNGADPLLRKEMNALLLSTSLSAKKTNGSEQDAILIALQKDIAQYLPQDQEQLILSEKQLSDQVDAMLARIFLFRAHQSRYNQLITEMRAVHGNPNVGMILRRLKVALPVALGEYVNDEIKTVGAEMRGRTKSVVENTVPPTVTEKTKL